MSDQSGKHEAALGFATLMAGAVAFDSMMAAQRRQALLDFEIKRRQDMADQGGGVIYHPQKRKGWLTIVGALVVSFYLGVWVYGVMLALTGFNPLFVFFAVGLFIPQVLALVHIWTLWARGLAKLSVEERLSLAIGGALVGVAFVFGSLVILFADQLWGVLVIAVSATVVGTQVWHAWRHRDSIRDMVEAFRLGPAPLEERIEPSLAGLQLMALRRQAEGAPVFSGTTIHIEPVTPRPGSYSEQG